MRLAALAVLAALASAAVLALAAPPAQAAPRVAFGAFTPDAPWNSWAIDAFAKKVGRQPALWSTFRMWGETPIPRSTLENVDAVGGVTLVSWHPTGAGLRSIARGDHDSYLRASARDAAAWGKPVFIRWGPEMNGEWAEWGVPFHGNTGADYIAAWRHIVDLFRSHGGGNVKWVWNPNVGRFDGMYPGDRWVDWLALDGYNWGAKFGSWESFDDIYASSYKAITRLSDKPVMIAEFASNEAGGDKAAWIRQTFSRENLERYPRIHAYSWFDVNKETDWRVDSSARTLSAFRSAIGSSMFDLDAKGLLAIGDQGGAPQPDPEPSPAPAAPPEPGSGAGTPRRLRCALYPRRVLRARWDLPVPLRCDRTPRVTWCAGTARVKLLPSGRTLGSARLDLAAGRTRGVRIGLPGWVSGALRHRSSVRARLTLSTGRGCRPGPARTVTIVRSR